MNSLPTIKLYKAVILVADKICGRKDSNIPYISLEHLDSNCSNLKRHGLAIDSISTNNVFKEDDILLGKLRPQLRKCIQSKIQGYCSTDILVFRPTNGASAQYLGHIFCSDIVFSEAIKREEGTGMPRTSWAAIKDLDIFYPSYSEQYKIAEILTTVDNLIEQTEAAIAKYQAIKQGMMHDLFTRGMDANGQLRPPREEAPGLYKESELGWIPKEWAAKPLEQLLEGNPKNGYSPREVDEWQGIYMLGLGCLTPRGFKPIQLKFAPINDRKISSALLSDGDLLISRANTIDLVGLVGIYKSIGEKCIYPDLMMRLKILPTIRSEFLEFTLQHYATRRKLTCLSQGTSSSMVKINAVNVKKLTIPYPGIPEQDSIIHALSSILANIKSEYEKMQKYQTIKSGLMQDLLSGRVRVPTDATPRQEPSHVS